MRFLFKYATYICPFSKNVTYTHNPDMVKRFIAFWEILGKLQLSVV